MSPPAEPAVSRPGRSLDAARQRSVARGRALAQAPRSAAIRAGRVVPGRLVPGRFRVVSDFAGWTTSEFATYAAQPAGSSPRRAPGREVVTRINAAGGELPIEAVLLARAIADAAPASPDDLINSTLGDVLERYLPESLAAYHLSTRRGRNDSAERLLLTQLELLHTVVRNVEQAETEHNERDLQIQDRFLRERFASLTPGELGLAEPRLPPTAVRSIDAPPRGRGKVVNPQARAFLEVDHEPVVLFRRDTPGPWDITLRLALPKGHPTVLGIVEETTAGATLFAQKASRGLLRARRTTGFRAAQVDLSLPLRLISPRRFLVYAVSQAGRAPVDTVLFVHTDAGSQAELRTALTNHPRAGLTVIASAYETPDGLVLRNESVLFPDLRAACAGFGYRNITWLDAHSPII